MQPLGKVMSSIFCCFGVHSHGSSQQRASLQRMPVSKDSPMSMSVPGASVPHALDSPDALHKIFASNSSARGYNAVQPIPSRRPATNGSLDLDFRFGSQSPKKPRGRLEQLTHHVKQKLSESRLSRSSDQIETAATAPIPLLNTSSGRDSDAATQLLSYSQRSIGLTELLASRTGSEGGYDSDAKSIQTPTILSTAATSKTGHKIHRTSLATIEGSQADGEPARLDDDENHTSTPLPLQWRKGSRKIPPVDQYFKLTSLEMVQTEHDGKPLVVATRVCDNAAKRDPGTPKTPKIHATRMPSVGECESNWRLSLDVSQPDLDIDVIKVEENRERRQRDDSSTTMTSVERNGFPDFQIAATSSTNRSIVEPNSSAHNSVDQSAAFCPRSGSSDMSAPVTAIKVTSKQLVNPTDDQENSDKVGMNSAKSSQVQSLHLFDMSIPQRLASISRTVQLSSADNSNDVSTRRLAPIPTTDVMQRSRPSSAGRCPTFIGIERNRCPSDPATKTLFESSGVDKSQPKWKRSLSVGSSDTRMRVMDDSSSYYGSVQEEMERDDRFTISSLKRQSLKNINSLAVGGRSVSGPRKKAYIKLNVDKLSEAERQSMCGKKPTETLRQSENVDAMHSEAPRIRNMSMPKSSKFVKVDTTPTPVGRRFHRSTEANETMSEVNLGNYLERSTEMLNDATKQTIKDLKDENLSEIDSIMVNAASVQRSSGTDVIDAWLSQGQRSGWGSDFTNKTPRKVGDEPQLPTNEDKTLRKSIPSQTDNADEIWFKAFQRLGDPIDRGRLLATPQFDREGRRKLSIQSVSDQGQPVRKASPPPIVHRRSQSVDIDRPSYDYDVDTQECRRRSVPVFKEPTFKALHKRKSQSPIRKRNLKKISLADIGRRIVSNRTSSDTDKALSLKDSLGIWGRFPSHTKEQRNGPAGAADGVKVRDFANENYNPSRRTSTPDTKLRLGHELRPRASWNILRLTKPILNRRNTKSMSFPMSPVERARQRRKGLADRFKRLYRTKSSEFYAYAMTPGHRSSVSTGLSAAYPELESLPGGSEFARGRSVGLLEPGTDGVAEQNNEAVLDTISEATSKISRSFQSYTLPWTKRDAEDWSKLYQDCVGSLSALRSDDEAGNNEIYTPSTKEDRVLSLTSKLRDSTVNFEADLRRDADQAKEKLLRQLQSSDESERVLRMPGSFI